MSIIIYHNIINKILNIKNILNNIFSGINENHNIADHIIPYIIENIKLKKQFWAHTYTGVWY